VTVAVLPSVAAELLPRAIAALNVHHPDITVALRDDVAESIPARVRSGEADFGLGAIHELDTDIVGSRLIADQLVAVFPPGHPLANAARPTWRAVAKFPFVAMSRDSSVRHLTERAFARNGLLLAPAIEAKYMSTAIGIIAHGLGVGALPSSAISMVQQAGLEHAEIHAPVMRRQIGILARRGRSLSPAAQALVAALKSMAAQ
jgi:DNA-binding transcriptional LysR family regulator